MQTKLLSSLRHLSFIMICASGLIVKSSAYSAETLPPSLTRDFTSVAKKAVPAVVSIKIKSAQSKSPYYQSPFSEGPDLFGDDFLYRFFFNPRGGRQPQQQQQPVYGQASGFIISSDGMILTNSHVVKDASEIKVMLDDGRAFIGKVIGQDPNTDVAVIKIEANNLPYLELGDSDQLEIGEWAIAVGNMLGLNELGLKPTLTVGVVSAKGRNNLDLANIEDFIQTDAAINRGNSGGPLLNIQGQVIGMNTAIATSMSSGGYLGMGFAIPSNILQHIMDQIIKTGSVSRGFLGVTLQTVDHDLAQAFDLKQVGGALVTDVTKNSPADKSGLKQGDIITAFNKQSVSSVASLKNGISLMTPGTKVSLTVVREGKTLQLPIEIGSYPDAEKEATIPTTSSNIGFEVQELTPELAYSLNLGDEKGVVVSKVDPTSLAQVAGLKKGALIVAVNQRKVKTIEEFNTALKATSKDRPVLLLVKQGEYMRYISLKTS